MRVLYFHQHFSTRDGKTGTRSYEFSRRLIERGHQVTVVCGSFQVGSTGLTGDPKAKIRRGTVDGIDVIELVLPYANKDPLIKRAFTFLKFAIRSARIALKEPADIVFATSTPLTAGIPGIVMKRFGRKLPFVFEVRDLWPELPKAMGVVTNPAVLKGMDWLESWSYHAADACIGLAPGIAEGIGKKRKDKSTIYMIPNGCDLELFHPSARGPIEGIEGINPGDFVALFSGAHGVANGLDLVLDAAKELKERGEDRVKIIFIGEGKEKPRLKERANAEGLENCLFLDAIPKKQLAKLVSSIDVGLMVLANVPAFYYGTSPNKFFDYISAGVPVLVCYPGWMTDMVRDNDCGAVVPPESPAAFAQALIDLKNRPDRADLGKRARCLAEKSFARDDLADQFVDVLEQTQAAFAAKRK